MEDKIFNLLKSVLISTRTMAFLFIAYAVAMGCGTFIEDKYNTETARILVYNAWWFEAIHLFFLINFLGNVKRYQLLKKEKWATLSLHLSFILIIIGAVITRYISFEGMMPIREGATANQIFSDKTYLTVLIDGQYKGTMKRKTIEKNVLFSQALDNNFSMKDNFADIPFQISLQQFIMNGKETITANRNGDIYLKMVESGGGTRHEHYLQSGQVVNIHNVLFALNKFTKGAINVTTTGQKYTIQTPFQGSFMRMADKLQGKVTQNATEPLMMRSLYNVGGAQFVFPEMAIKGVKTYVSNNDYKDKKTDDVLVLNLETQGKQKKLTLLGSKGKMGEPQAFTLGDLDFTVYYGSKVYTTPFTVKLNDFVAEKYAGTEKNYSAFESKVTVNDPADNKNFDTRIFMNNVLDYKGYRLFQASFDEDEKGTILSVNHDFWGTWITYIGYFILFFGMMAILFTKYSRFADLKRKLDIIKDKKSKLITVLLLSLSCNVFAQPHKPNLPTKQQIDSILQAYQVNESHAASFGRLVIQDEKGRMKPINTFSSELLRKVSKSDTYNGMNSDQAFLSMCRIPQVWYNVPIIYLQVGNDSIRKIIGLKPDAKKAALIDFFDDKGNYKLSKYMESSSKATVKNNFEKDFVETDKKVTLLYSALSGSILRIFPIPNDKGNKWISFLELNHSGMKGMDSVYSKSILPLYFSSLKTAKTTSDYKVPDDILKSIDGFQKKYGAAILPSEKKINSEILYNKYDIFKKLYYLYMLAGVLMLVFVIVNIFFEKKAIRYVINGFHFIIGFLFALHTLGLVARWYISGHAPWSDAYESMIYVAWAVMLFTLLFGFPYPIWYIFITGKKNIKKSMLTIASGTFVASMILMIASWNWMDPAIGNLQPVLNSYWLMIHVAVIVGSYGPFTLAMVLGVVALILMLFVNEKNKVKMNLNIQEITYINEMALTIGLVMLTIGNFLGGQWANESWGRYWGWDPKETWALISIMVYAFVIHARFVPALRGKWIYNLMSVLAFYSIMMTYFGVNFYLTGLHSYASGDKVVTPNFVYVSLGCLAVLAFFSFLSNKKYLKK